MKVKTPGPETVYQMNLPKWDERFFRLAKHIREWSQDPNKQVGAVLVGTDKRQVALGINGPPAGLPKDTDKQIMGMPQAEKNQWMIHAERQVLDNAHFPLAGSTLYSTRWLCPDCARSASSLGVARVLAPPPEPESSWYECQLTAAAILRASDVRVLNVLC
mgnify:CR=1 FL=1